MKKITSIQLYSEKSYTKAEKKKSIKLTRRSRRSSWRWRRPRPGRAPCWWGCCRGRRPARPGRPTRPLRGEGGQRGGGRGLNADGFFDRILIEIEAAADGLMEWNWWSDFDRFFDGILFDAEGWWAGTERWSWREWGWTAEVNEDGETKRERRNQGWQQQHGLESLT